MGIVFDGGLCFPVCTTVSKNHANFSDCLLLLLFKLDFWHRNSHDRFVLCCDNLNNKEECIFPFHDASLIGTVLHHFIGLHIYSHLVSKKDEKTHSIAKMGKKNTNKRR